MNVFLIVSIVISPFIAATIYIMKILWKDRRDNRWNDAYFKIINLGMQEICMYDRIDTKITRGIIYTRSITIAISFEKNSLKNTTAFVDMYIDKKHNYFIHFDNQKHLYKFLKNIVRK